MATLEVINNFITTVNGVPKTAWQGATTAAIGDAVSITLAGRDKLTSSILATAAILVVYDDSVDTQVSDLYYTWYKADQATYIQLINSTNHVVIGPLAANVPISIGAYATLKILGVSSSTTAITGGAEPSTLDVKKVVIGNYSGTNANYTFGVFL